MGLGESSARMPKMAIHHFRIACPSQSAAFLHEELAHEEVVGGLAAISSRHPIRLHLFISGMGLGGHQLDEQPRCRIGAS
jgi:hypothetical protein